VTERSHGFADDDFASLISRLAADTEYTKAIDDMDSALAELEVTSRFTGAPGQTTDPRGRFYTVPLEAEVSALVEGFETFCRQQRLDLMRPDITPEDLAELDQHIALEMYALRRSLQPGDVVSARGALIIDMDSDEEGGVGVDYVPENQCVQGILLSPVIGQMPDDFFAVTQDEAPHAPIGLGLMIADPIIIESSGERAAIADDERRVIIVLGTLGLKMEKLMYESNELFITPPDDNPDTSN
jgi:hypothetical protein